MCSRGLLALALLMAFAQLGTARPLGAAVTQNELNDQPAHNAYDEMMEGAENDDFEVSDGLFLDFIDNETERR